MTRFPGDARLILWIAAIAGVVGVPGVMLAKCVGID